MKRFVLAITTSIVVLLSSTGFSAERCGLTTQGGVIDVFPWSLAEPFAWNSIQGLWQVPELGNQIFKLRVVRTTQKVKQIKVEVFSRSLCSMPILKGSGYISYDEPNVVRFILRDRGGRVKLMKLAYFVPETVLLKSEICGQSVLVGSIMDLSSESFEVNRATLKNMMLKKISPSLDFSCSNRKD